MKLKRILGNLLGAPTFPASQPGRYLIMRQHDIDCAAGRRGVLMAKAKQKRVARLKQIWEWMREGNEVRRFTRERQLEERETRRLDRICLEDRAVRA